MNLGTHNQVNNLEPFIVYTYYRKIFQNFLLDFDFSDLENAGFLFVDYCLLNILFALQECGTSMSGHFFLNLE